MTRPSRSSIRSPASIAITGRRRGARSGSTTRQRVTSTPGRARLPPSLPRSTPRRSTIAASAVTRSPTRPARKRPIAIRYGCFGKPRSTIDPPLQIVEIPFGDNKLVGYLQIPRGLARPPVVMHWGGVDGWKEDRLRHSATLHSAGLATLTIDMPGTGENPVLYGAPDAERTYSAWIDHLAQRDRLDGTRIGVWGGSFGAYWAARLAFVEASASRARCSTVAMCITAFRRMAAAGVHHRRRDLSVWCRPICSKRADRRWARRPWRSS